MTNMNRRC